MQVSVREARESDSAGIARAFVDSFQAAYHNLGPASLLQFSYEDSERNWRRSLREIQASEQSREFIYVAEIAGIEGQTGTIVGVAMGGPERTAHPGYAGELYVLAVLPGYHRHGLGRALVKAVVQALSEREMRGLLVRVLKANRPARKFYQALGGQLVLQEKIEDDTVVLDQVGYGWMDIQRLLDSLHA